MKKNIHITLLVCVTLLGASCGKIPDSTDDVGWEIPVAPDATPNATDMDSDRNVASPSANDDGLKKTNNVAAQIVHAAALLNLGKSPEQTMERMVQFGYNWSPEYEYVDSENRKTYHVFSDIEGVSRCTIYGTNLYELLPEKRPGSITTQNLETLWEKEAKEYAADSDDSGRYEFDFGEIAVQVSADAFGAISDDFPNAAAYKPQGEFIDAIGDVKALRQKERISAATRNGVLNETFDQYVSMLGTPLDEIARWMTPLGENEYESLRFEADGVEYLVNSRLTSDGNVERICDVIICPAANIFGNEETIDMTYLKSRGLAFRWECFDGYRYWYSFEDVLFYMESDSDGLVMPEASVVIKTP